MSINLGRREIKLTRESMIISETDARGIIRFASNDFCAIAGYSQEELIGQPHNIIRHNIMPKSAFEDMWTKLNSGKRWTGIVVNKTKEDDFYWVRSTVYPSSYADGSRKFICIRMVPTDDEIAEALKLYSNTY